MVEDLSYPPEGEAPYTHWTRLTPAEEPCPHFAYVSFSSYNEKLVISNSFCTKQMSYVRKIRVALITE